MSDTGFCPHFPVIAYQLGPIDSYSLALDPYTVLECDTVIWQMVNYILEKIAAAILSSDDD